MDSVELMLRKNAFGGLYILSNNHIVLEKEDEICLGSQPYLVSCARNCGPAVALVASLEDQAKTLARVVEVCRASDLLFHFRFPSGHSIRDFSRELSFQMALALSEDEVAELYQLIGEILEEERKRKFTVGA